MRKYCLNIILIGGYLASLGILPSGNPFARGDFFFFPHLGREGEPAWTADGSRVDWASQLEHVNLLEATQHFGDTEMGSPVHCQF